jgi:hypothetical protein
MKRERKEVLLSIWYIIRLAGWYSIRLAIALDSKEKEIIEKFIMNYGRYYEIRNIPKELRPKVPKEINVFVKKYTLKRRLSATSFYIFEGEEREKIVETLKAFA